MANSASGSVVLWNIPGVQAHEEQRFPYLLNQVIVRPNGQELYLGASSSSFTVWDAASEQSITPLATLANPTETIYNLRLNQDGSLLAIGTCETKAAFDFFCIGGKIYLWDTGRSAFIGDPIAAHDSGTEAMAFNADSTRLVSSTCLNKDPSASLETVCPQASLRLWNLTSGQMLAEVNDAQPSDIYDVVFSPDSQLLATSGCATYSDEYCEKGNIKLWDARNDQLLPINSLIGHEDAAYLLIFSPDSKLLISGGLDGLIIVWDVETGKSIRRFRVSGAHYATALALSADGKLLAAGSDDGAIILWDIESGLRLGEPLLEFDTPVSSMSLSADGSLLIAADSNGNVSRLGLKRDDWIAIACDIANRSLTSEEWDWYLGGATYAETCPVQGERHSVFAQEIGASPLTINQPTVTYNYSKMVELVAAGNDVGLNNELCWQGSLIGLAEMVMPDCDHLIEITSTVDNRFFRDTRGLARALTHDYSGAIEDFESFLTYLQELDTTYYTNFMETAGQLRLRMIDNMNAGLDPLEDDIRDLLRDESFTMPAIDSGFYIRRGDFYYDAQDYEKALADYNQSLQLDDTPAQPEKIYYQMAEAYTFLGDQQAAIDHYTRSIEADPEYLEGAAYFNRANLHAQRGELNLALDDLQKAVGINPNNAAYYAQLGTIQTQLGLPAQSSNSLAAANFVLAAEEHIANQDFALAAEAAKQAIELDGSNADGYYYLGLAYQRQNDFALALENYGLAIAHDPAMAVAYNQRGFVYLNLGRYEDALADLLLAVQYDPTSATHFSNLAYAHKFLGHIDDAIAAFKQAIALEPGYSAAYNGLGGLYYDQGDYLAALENYQAADQYRPDNSNTLLGLGNTFYRLGRNQEALDTYRHYVEVAGSTADPAVLDIIVQLEAILQTSS